MKQFWNGRGENIQDPIFRWAGGKRQLRNYLLENCPRADRIGRYFEPFLGAGSLFWALSPRRAVLGDANQDLVATYSVVKANYEGVAKHLRRLATRHSEDTYYTVRAQYNERPGQAHVQAARFIYLNRTCFNGIFRVNQKGHFNVPFGRIAKPWFPAADDLRRIANALRGAKLMTGDYRASLAHAGQDDFVYLDPPYPPLNGTSFFTHYTKDRFDENDQLDVAETFRDLDRIGCRVMLSNADTPLIRRLYRGYRIRSLPVNRWITCKSEKHVVRELVVTNYSV